MRLSSKQVSIDGFDWTKALLQAQTLELPKLPVSGAKRSQQQSQIEAPEQLKCPRCDSTNTKFCYYNNYNKSQPRHFCRACKRHWTKGGTLRNVPVGGGRKNKRLKKSTTPTKSTSAAAAATSQSIADGVLNSQTSGQDLSLSFGRDQKNLSDFLYQGLVFPPVQSFVKDSGGWPESENFSINYGVLNTQMNIRADRDPNFSAVSSSTSLEARQSPISNSFPSSNICDYDKEFKAMEMEPTISSFPQTTTSSTRVSTHPWQSDVASCYWSWDDIDTFAATDLNVPWNDKDIKP